MTATKQVALMSAVILTAHVLRAADDLETIPRNPPQSAKPQVPGIPAKIKTVKSIDDCNLTWESPSGDSFGSMPLGNGDVGANVWVEKNGDLVFYMSKVDAFDADHLLPKLGRVRLRLAPPLSLRDFRQTLVLRDGAVEVQGGDVRLRVWVDANHPALRIEGESSTPRQVTANLETLRPLTSIADPGAAKLPTHGTVGILLDDKSDRLAWCYRNMSSAWAERLRNQNTPEMVARADDPLLERASGCLMQGPGLSRKSATCLASRDRLMKLDITVRVLSAKSPTLAQWFSTIQSAAATEWSAHQQWWRAFWDRSYIFVRRCGDRPVQLDPYRFSQTSQASRAYRGHQQIDRSLNAFQVSQRYALERFAEACASRGAVPPPYNGSIFTMDMPAGALGFNGPKGGPTSADARDWAILSFMWQNTRHPYWAMPTRGDYDTLLPGMKFVRDGLDICSDRCRNIFHHDGAFIMEASWWHNVGVFDWNGVPQHLRYHFLATIELPAIMCDYYEHTQDNRFLAEILLPCADEFIKFYELQFPKHDARGKIVMEPAATVETYQPVTNPCTEICGLRYVLQKLTGMDEQLIGRQRKLHWTKLLAAMPEAPLRRIKGCDLLAVGEKYASGREICEGPEMYSVYPFRQAWQGNGRHLAAARQSLHLRTVSLDGTGDSQPVETGGWQAAPVQAAYLGLPREAARLTSINFNDDFIAWHGNVDPDSSFPTRPKPRFPAFWETKMDGTPDNDHGANSANALQSMLLQSDGRKIYLLPAWPEDWDVSFKLHAAYNTTIECLYRGGKVQSLLATPASRRADVIDRSTRDERIRTMVQVACNDCNHLFGLPPMLDGLPIGGPATGEWLQRYGESLNGVRGGPWPGCVYRDNVIYVHMLNGRSEPPKIPARLVASKYLTTEDDKLDAILKLEFDRPIEPIARTAFSKGSLTADKRPVNGEIDLGKVCPFDRVEFTIDNPGHRYGEGKPFELQVKQPDSSWRTVHAGHVFGTIYSKRIDPVAARFVRLKIDAPAAGQFDLFKDGAP